jgi:hypothetical protein
LRLRESAFGGCGRDFFQAELPGCRLLSGHV